MSKKVVALTFSDASRIGPYVKALEAAGLVVNAIGPGEVVRLEEIDGLVLSGGIDLNPKLYGEQMHPEADEPDDIRDATELALLHASLERDMPVLAICRGMQLLNVALGGSLVQHIQACDVHRRYDQDKSIAVHCVKVVPETQLAGILGEGLVAVNSRHHQALARIGLGLIVSASSEDGLVEGIELPGMRFAIGVQWHPEDQAAGDPLQAHLFEAFAASLA
jgi:putative glutamine amidotransferase